MTHEENRTLTDLSPREIAVFAPILVLLFLMGLYPKPLLSRMEPSVAAIVAHVERHRKNSEPPNAGPVTEARAADRQLGRAL